VTVVGVRDLDVYTGCFDDADRFQKVTLVQAVNQSIPCVFEGAIADLGALVSIIFERDGIQDIYPGAFRNLPKLGSVQITHNDFHTIREKVFSGLPVSELILSDNSVHVIETGAFDNMENLNIITLDNNKIGEWNGDWFSGSPQITTVSFINNEITRIPSRAFRNLKSAVYIKGAELNLSLTLNLNENRIRYLEDDAFDGLESIGWVFLQQNELEEIRPEALGSSLKEIDWLRLEHNNLRCIPDQLLEVAKNVKFYLEGNNLSDECEERLDIKSKRNIDLDKFDLDIHF